MSSVDRRHKNNSCTFNTPRNGTISKYVENIEMQKIKFEYPQKFTIEDKIGVFIEYLINIVLSKPLYINNENINFYTAFLYDFLNFEIEDVSKVKRKIMSSNLSELFSMLEVWVRHYIKKDIRNPLYATFSLETSRFIENHALGYDFWSKSGLGIELISLVKNLSHQHRITQNQYLKTLITRDTIGEIVVRVKSPIGCILKINNKSYCFCDKTFDYEIKRCHLSTDLFNNNYSQFIYNNDIEFDISEDFKFDGFIIDTKENIRNSANRSDIYNQITKTYQDEFGHHICRVRLPIWWIIGVYQPDSTNESANYLQVPRWSIE